ncbi:MAG: deoxyribose-phosphate aldolase [Thomasclavelia ramosa]
MQRTLEEITQYIDHTLLKPYASKEAMQAFCNEAKELKVKMVAINSYYTKFCKELLKDTTIHVGAAISFPLGQTTIAVKAFETIEAIKDGADEIDYVLNLAKVKDGDFTYIKEEMETIVKICREAGIISKVIFENCYLTKDEIRKCAQIAKEVKPILSRLLLAFGPGGALIEDVKIMLETVDGVCKVKAAGGIRDYKTFNEFINLGVERIGTSSTKTIIKEFKENDE